MEIKHCTINETNKNIACTLNPSGSSLLKSNSSWGGGREGMPMHEHLNVRFPQMQTPCSQGMWHSLVSLPWF